MQTAYRGYDILKVTYRDRLPERFLATQIHQVDSNGKGCLIVIFIEIPSPWHPANELGMQLTNSLAREVSRSTSPSLLIRFENALKATNYLITKVQEKQNIPVSCAVLLIQKAQIHLSSIGSPSIALVRADKFASIGAGEGGKDQDSTTFTTVTSGDLQDNEWLVIGNQNLLRTARNLPESVWQKDGEAVKEALSSGSIAANHQAISGCFLKYRHENPGSVATLVWEELEPTVPLKLPAIKRLTPPSISAQLPSLEALLRALRAKLRSARPPVFVQNLSLKPPVLRLKIRPIWPTIITQRKFSLKMFALVGVALLIVGAAFFTWRDRSERARQEITKTIYQQWQERLPESTDAALEFLINNFNQKQFDSLTDNDKESFLRDVKAAGIMPITSLELFSKLPADVAAVDQVDDTLFAIDQSGQLWRYDNNVPVKIEQAHPVSSPISLTALTKDKVLVSDALSNVWYFDLSTPAPKQNETENDQTQATRELPRALTLPASLSNGRKLLGKFNSNVYLYHQESRNLFRVTNFVDNLNRASRYNSGDFLSNTEFVDLAINGSVIGIDRLGLITKFRSGGPETTISVAAASGNFRLDSNAANQDWFICQDRTIWRVSNNGEIKSVSFIFADVSVARNRLSSDGKRLFLTAGTDIYLINAEQL